MKPQSLAVYDRSLRERLDHIDDQALLESARAVPSSHRLTVEDLRSWTRAGRTWALDVLASIDLAGATRLADDLWRLEEITHITWTDHEKLERRQRAFEVMKQGFHLWTLDEVVDALASGRMYIDFGCSWQHERRAMLFEHPALGTPDRLFAALESSVGAFGWKGNPNWLTWLLHRLIEAPFPAAAPWLEDAWREQRTTTFEPSLAEAVLAAARPEGIGLIVATLDDDRPSHDVMTALVCLDPSNASQRLRDWLDPFPEQQPKRGQAMALLHALAQDGFRAGELLGSPSRRPLGWVRRDPGWVSILLSCRKNKDPNISYPARSALERADPEIVQSFTPKPTAKKQKKLPEARLTPLGSAGYVAEQYWGVPVATCETALALFSRPDHVQVLDLTDGLPVRFERQLPGNLRLPDTRRESNDDGWDRAGVHGIAIHPTGCQVAVSAFVPEDDFSGVVAFTAEGEMHRWQTEDTLPNRLHFGPANTLWVLCERDGPTVVALDASTLKERGTCALSEFPPPAYVDGYPHPTDDVGVFQAVCGQDGYWVKCVEQGPKKLKVRSQKLSSVHHDSLLYGYCAGGAVAITLLESKLLLRQWPDMKPLKGKVIEGNACDASGSGDHVLVTVARSGHAAEDFEVFKAPRWDRVAVGKWPEKHWLVALQGDKVITAEGGKIHLWKLDL